MPGAGEEGVAVVEHASAARPDQHDLPVRLEVVLLRDGAGTRVKDREKETDRCDMFETTHIHIPYKHVHITEPLPS